MELRRCIRDPVGWDCCWFLCLGQLLAGQLSVDRQQLGLFHIFDYTVHRDTLLMLEGVEEELVNITYSHERLELSLTEAQ